MKKILILGAGISQYPTITSTKNMGWKSIVIDENPNALYKGLADTFEVADIKDKEAVLKIAERHKPDGVVCPGTDFPVTAAYVAEKLGLPGIPVEVAERCSNKHLMRKALKEAGLFVPKFAFFSLLEYRESGIRRYIDFDYPMVVKPVDNMAARGSRIVFNKKEFDEAIINAFKFSHSSTVILEEFKEGMELSIDALVYNGEVKIFGIGDRHFSLSPYLIEIGHTVPSILDKEIIEEANKTFIEAVKALGIEDGAAKGDIKITSDGIMIVELAARISGGFLSGWTIPYAHGINPHMALLDIVVGNPPKCLDPIWNRWSAERVLMSIPGKIQAIEMGYAKHIAKFIHLHVKEGDEVNFPVHSAERCGSVITLEDFRRDAINEAKRAVKEIFLRLEPHNKETEYFIGSGPDFRMFIPGEKETDWHDVDIAEALQMVKSITSVNFNKILHNKKFWKYFYKGGIQGGVYYIDTYL